MTPKTLSKTTTNPAAPPRSKRRPIPVPIVAFVGAISLALMEGYFSAVFLLDEPGLPFRFDLMAWFMTTCIVSILSYATLIVAIKYEWFSVERVRQLLLLTISLLFSILFLDASYRLYLETMTSKEHSASTRETDEHTWIGELYPRLYYPTKYNFRLHKPGVSVTGTHFGLFYDTSMLASPTLVEHVLERNTVTIDINDRGFRESGLMEDANIFALGDSFAFGWGVNEMSGWPELLESATGENVYNLGIHDASPKQELDLLNFVLHNYKESRRMRHLLWMIYEGNDLEDDYSELHGKPATDRWSVRGKVYGLLASITGKIKNNSVIRMLCTERIIIRKPKRAIPYDPYMIDGVRLAYPLYHSEALGARLFVKQHIERAQTLESYVQGHPNCAYLESVFHDMAKLAREFDFEVTVLLAPTAARLHGPFFDNFPEISERPHFLDYVARLSRSANFGVIDLYEHLSPYAASELLFFRDDDHFNQRGHELVSEIIQKKRFARNSTMMQPVLVQAKGGDREQDVPLNGLGVKSALDSP